MPLIRHFGMTLLVAFGVVTGAPEIQAAGRVTVVSADPKADWNIFAGRGICTAPICTVMTDLAMSQSGPDPDVCGVLDKARATAKGIRWPVWQHQDFRKHVDEIKEVISEDNAKYQIVPGGTRLTFEGARRANEEYWRRFGPSILKLFETGIASYDTTEFDFDSDGVPDSLYRISSVAPVTLEPGEHPRAPADNTAWRLETCDKAGRRPLYHIFIGPEERDRLSRLSGNYFLDVDSWFKKSGNHIDIFKFQGLSYFVRAYWRSASLEEARPNYFLRTEIWTATLSEGRNSLFAPSPIQTWRSLKP